MTTREPSRVQTSGPAGATASRVRSTASEHGWPGPRPTLTPLIHSAALDDALTRLSRPGGGSLGVQLFRDLQRTYGNRALTGLVAASNGRALQKKSCGGCGGGWQPDVVDECAECREKRLALQRRSASQADATEVPPIVGEVLQSSGQPLDASTRAFFEARFGRDFSGVRLHADARATESAHALNSLAYTAGRHIVFASGQYSPGTTGGLRLLAHELTHVVQQASGAIQAKPEIGPAGDPFEREADAAAASIVSDRPVAIRGAGPPPSIQRALICARPLDIPVLGLIASHAFVNDPPANYAIRGLVSGTGISGCATTTDASGPPDDPATSICKPCNPKPGQTPADVSRCLRASHAAYASPNIYRNLPDPGDSFRWGPNSNTYAATLAKCCADPSSAGLGFRLLPGWNHSPARPCPAEQTRTRGGAAPARGAAPPAPAAPCSHPINWAHVNPRDQGANAIRVDITWDSSTGNLADLADCTVREVVRYDPIPNPPFLFSPPNPTILEVPGRDGAAMDTHSYPDLRTNISNPRRAGTMTSNQVYQHRCTGPGCSGTWTEFPGQTYRIRREVFPQFVRPNPWRYRITKRGTGPGNTFSYSREVEIPPR